MPKAVDDFQALIAEIKNGSTDAVAVLVEQYADSLSRVIRRRLHQKMRTQFDTVDFAQIVWASFFSNLEHLSRFSSSHQLELFLLRTAENKVIDACRRLMILQKNNVNREQRLYGRTSSLRIDVASTDPSPSHLVSVREQWERLKNSLPVRYREIIGLRAAGHKIHEIAEKIRVNEKTVRRVLDNLSKGNLP